MQHGNQVFAAADEGELAAADGVEQAGNIFFAGAVDQGRPHDGHVDGVTVMVIEGQAFGVDFHVAMRLVGAAAGEIFVGVVEVAEAQHVQRTDQHQPSLAGLPQGFQDVARAAEIDGVDLIMAVLRADRGRTVVDDVRAANRRRNGRRVADVAHSGFRALAAQGGSLFRVPHQAPRSLFLRQKGFDYVASQKARRSRHQRRHVSYAFRCVCRSVVCESRRLPTSKNARI